VHALELVSKAAAAASEEPKVRPAGLLTARSLRVAGKDNKRSRVFLGPDGAGFSIGTAADSSTFTIEHDSRPEPLLELQFKQDASSDSVRFLSKNLQVASLAAPGGVTVRGVKQWELARSEDFSSQAVGWSRDTVTKCGGVSMLGGFCRFSTGDVNKTFDGLPPHRQLRIKATYHFIDRWIGESGYMKVNIGQDDRPVVVWSDQWSQQLSKNGLSLCGQQATPEGKFAATIDVTLEHTKDSVDLSFGSTMADSDPCDESWGISGLEIYTRAGTAKMDSVHGPTGPSRSADWSPVA
jgi:hypothetical protein